MNDKKLSMQMTFMIQITVGVIFHLPLKNWCALPQSIRENKQLPTFKGEQTTMSLT